ncbi:HET and ankyrin domain protein [Xylogone sp. PMI_703]|nr:HET and ankyrin domain protein [Xylogone sp. PMI_703]
MMHLINTKTCKLETLGNPTPLYAILSHTWGGDEITLQDIQSGKFDENKEGYKKLRNTCSVAASHGFEHVWVDTCCIDKTSSAELSEAINSMYHWYQESGVCYAYLSDVPSCPTGSQAKSLPHEFSTSRWFRRGWTLQELIAPSTLIFLDQEWQQLGTKSSLQEDISEITAIPAEVLLTGDLKSTSIAQRMSWASRRETTRIEDIAYSLMGIFGVNMPMLYGEGEKAFIRLQEEIMKFSDDYSLFAWSSNGSRGGLLATSPAAFANSRGIVTLEASKSLGKSIMVDNKGIHLMVRSREIRPGSTVLQAILSCGLKSSEEWRVAIHVEEGMVETTGSDEKEIPESTGFYERIKDRHELLGIDDTELVKYRERRICIRRERLTRRSEPPLMRAARCGAESVVELLLSNGANANFRAWDGYTPLIMAARNGHEGVVKLLLTRGAEVDLKDTSFKRTPLLWATLSGHEKVVRLLLEAGAEVEFKDRVYRRTSLGWAAYNANKEVVKVLLEKGARPNSKDRYGRTALSWAAIRGHEELVRLLLERADVEVDSKDAAGRSPLSWAAVTKEEEDTSIGSNSEGVLKLLLDTNAVNIESRDVNGETPLSLATGEGYLERARLLLEKVSNTPSA